MSGRILRQFLREWAVVLAVFTMVLAPLGSAVARGLAASEKVAVAAGLAAPALCLPEATADGLAQTIVHACDHCLPVQAGAPGCPMAPIALLAFAERLQPADTGPSALLDRLRLPPATGPPSA